MMSGEASYHLFTSDSETRIERLLDGVRDELLLAGLDPAGAGQMRSAVALVCESLIDNARSWELPRELEIGCKRLEGDVEVSIVDPGVLQELEAIREGRAPDAEQEGLDMGRLGPLIHAFEFECSGGKSTILMRRHIPELTADDQN